MNLKKILLVSLGCLCFALGAIGTVIPLLPTVPFFMAAAFCFAKSSEKLNNWFRSTKVYKNNLESYVNGKGMTIKTKVKIMTMVTLLLTVGFIMMDEVLIGRIVLAVVWICHILYFIFGIKTLGGKAVND